jgi:hypothetical protein
MLLLQWLVCVIPGSSDIADSYRYPYPIFEALPTPGRVGLFSLSALVMALSTITLKWLFGRVNGLGNPIKPQSRPGDIKRKEGL